MFNKKKMPLMSLEAKLEKDSKENFKYYANM